MDYLGHKSGLSICTGSNGLSTSQRLQRLTQQMKIKCSISQPISKQNTSSIIACCVIFVFANFKKAFGKDFKGKRSIFRAYNARTNIYVS